MINTSLMNPETEAMLNASTLSTLPNALYPIVASTPQGYVLNPSQGTPAFSPVGPSAASAQPIPSTNPVNPSVTAPDDFSQRASQQVGQVKSVDPKTLKMGNSFGVGALYGGLFGGLVGLPLFGIERLCEHNSMAEVFTMFEQQGIGKDFCSKMIPKVSSKIGHCTSSVLTVGLLGMGAGAVLGPWMAHRVNNRLKDINEAKQQQAQGLWQPKRPNLMQKLGLADKPVDNPDQDYQDLLNNNLNPDKAFTQGAIDVLKLKVVKAAIPLSIFMGIGLYARKNPSYFGSILTQQLAITMRQFSQPIFWAKLAALPVVGGLVAQKMVPQMREKLNIDGPTA
jgi:hypothetical protein